METKEEKTQFPIDIEVKIKQDGKTIEKKFKILDCFYADDRLDELVAIPQTPYGKKDYWLASKMLCKKLSGRLPDKDELTIIASLIERKIIDLPHGAYWSSVEVSSSQARRRDINSNDSDFYTDVRSSSGVKALCVGD